LEEQADIKVIFGIGNPGKKYENTKHNIGFFILDKIAEKHKIKFKASKGEYEIAESTNHAFPFFLVKPVTYVNLSGIAALDIFERYSIDIDNFLVVVDDLNLELGKIRIRKSGSDGGHNGLKSIIYHLQTDQFPRLRFGIGNDFKEGEMANYVLSKFTEETSQKIIPRIDFCVELIESFIRKNIQSTLNLFSKRSNAFNESSDINTKGDNLI
jgi:PTH1 family peptidyl-tRNA hydrolase